MLKERVRWFLDEFAMPKTEFCRRINLSTNSLNSWLKGTLNLSDKTLKRIEDYLRKYDQVNG